jgi:sarcosine oxidase, subunit beta
MEITVANNTADVIVVGAGVNGSSIAFHLAERGAKTTVIERGGIAGGTTGDSGALVRMHYTDPYQAKLAVKSLSYFADWKHRVGAGDPGFVRSGVLVVGSPKNADAIRANVRMLQSVGVNTCVINADDTLRLQPWINPFIDDIDVCGFEPDSGCAEPADTARGLAKAAEQHGAKFVTSQPVTSINISNGRVTGVTTPEATWYAPTVIVAANVWSVPLFADIGVELPIKVARTGCFLLKRQGELPMGRDGHMVVIDRPHNFYFRPYRETESLAGGSGRNRPARSADDYDEQPDDDFVHDVSQLVARLIPSMKGAQVTSGWAGITDTTPDGCPIFESNVGADGLFLAAGFSGTGFKTAPYVGNLMATWATTGERPADAAPFTLSRFETGDLITSEYPYVREPVEVEA